MPSLIWQTSRFQLDLTQPLVMGIVNLTPDSFSDGGQFFNPCAALKHCEQLLKEGVHILDVGGESSRPGSLPVDLDEEWRRVEPILCEVVGWNCPVSLDTTKPELMRRALDLGVDIINDINALRSPGALEVITSARCGVCLMHMQGQPEQMQARPCYEDVVSEVSSYLLGRVELLRARGVADARVVLDPGIGFGKSVAHNFELLRHQSRLLDLGFPVLVGWSRKSSLGAVMGRATTDRLPASLAAALAAVIHGARVVRVHDVAATVDALKVWQAAGLPRNLCETHCQ
jgi:dihydropteroate synthase